VKCFRKNAHAQTQCVVIELIRFYISISSMWHSTSISLTPSDRDSFVSGLFIYL
jgi:hypothetical protein